MKRFDEAKEEIKKAKELDPLSLVINKNVGWVFYYARQYDKALNTFQKTLELDPNFSWVHIHIGQVYIQKSMYEEALKVFNRENELSRGLNPVVEPLIGVTYSLMGRKNEAFQVINGLIEKSEHAYVSPTLMALIYLSVGDKDQCFNWLNKAYEDHDGWLRHFKEDPLFDGVRTDRRFKELLKRMNLD